MLIFGWIVLAIAALLCAAVTAYFVTRYFNRPEWTKIQKGTDGIVRVGVTNKKGERVAFEKGKPEQKKGVLYVIGKDDKHYFCTNAGKVYVVEKDAEDEMKELFSGESSGDPEDDFLK